MNENGSQLCDAYWWLLGNWGRRVAWGPLKLTVDGGGGRGGASRVQPSLKWDVSGR